MRTPIVIVSGAVAALIACVAGPALADPAFANRNVNIRSGPGLNYEAVDQLVIGEPVDRGKCNPDGSWCYIKHEGTNGWVAAVFLSTTVPGQQPTPPTNPTPPQNPPPATSSTYRAKSVVNIRSGPGPGFSIVDKLDAGEVVTRGDCSADGVWCYVSHDGADGWVSASFLIANQPVPPQNPPPQNPPPQNPPNSSSRIATASVNVRSGPAPTFSVLDRLDAGERVALGQCTPDAAWCYITHDGPDGWVAASFLAVPNGGSGNPGPNNPGQNDPGTPMVTQKIGTAIAGMPVRADANLFTATVGRLERGQRIEVLSCSDDGYWCHVKNTSLDGWVPAAFLTISEVQVPAPAPSNAAVTAQATPMRQMPGNFGALIGTLPAGATVEVLQCGPSGNWCQVTYGNSTGWVAASALKPPASAPVAPPSPNQPDQVCVTGFGGIQFCIGQ